MEENVSLFWHMVDWPSCTFSWVPLPGDLGNSHQGFGVQFRGLSLENQSRRRQGAKRERERQKVQEAGKVCRGPGRTRGTCVHSQGGLEESCPEEGSVQMAQESSRGQHRGARGQGVTSSSQLLSENRWAVVGLPALSRGEKCPSAPLVHCGWWVFLGAWLSSPCFDFSTEHRESDSQKRQASHQGKDGQSDGMSQRVGLLGQEVSRFNHRPRARRGWSPWRVAGEVVKKASET